MSRRRIVRKTTTAIKRRVVLIEIVGKRIGNRCLRI
jgi:hypothetical protein